MKCSLSLFEPFSSLGNIYHQLKELVLWGAVWETQECKIHTDAGSRKVFNLPTAPPLLPLVKRTTVFGSCVPSSFSSASAEAQGAAQAQGSGGWVREVKWCQTKVPFLGSGVLLGALERKRGKVVWPPGSQSFLQSNSLGTEWEGRKNPNWIPSALSPSHLHALS